MHYPGKHTGETFRTSCESSALTGKKELCRFELSCAGQQRAPLSHVALTCVEELSIQHRPGAPPRLPLFCWHGVFTGCLLMSVDTRWTLWEKAECSSGAQVQHRRLLESSLLSCCRPLFLLISLQLCSFKRTVLSLQDKCPVVCSTSSKKLCPTETTVRPSSVQTQTPANNNASNGYVGSFSSRSHSEENINGNGNL